MQRRQDVHLGAAVPPIPESRRQHSRNPQRHGFLSSFSPVRLELPPDYLRVRAETIAPQIMPNDRRLFAAFLELFLKKSPTYHWLHAQAANKTRGSTQPPDRFCRTLAVHQV